MNRQLVALLLVAYFGLYGVECHSEPSEELDRWDVSGATNRYEPEQLSELLGKAPMEPEEVLRVLAATFRKEQAKILLDKYSVNDLLAVKDAKEFTPEEFNQKLALCESLKAETSESSLAKNLQNYCARALDEYHYSLKLGMKVDRELEDGLKRLDDDVWNFCMERNLEPVKSHEVSHAKEVMAAYLEGKQADEVAQIKRMCSDFYTKVKFVAERALRGRKSVPFRYQLAYTNCEGLN